MLCHNICAVIQSLYELWVEPTFCAELLPAQNAGVRETFGAKPDTPQTRMLDIGSGAGFPGLPLKIVRPQWQVLLLEATGKKVAFLQHIIKTLQLKNVVAVHGRAEELAHKAEYRAWFDVVTARAVASIPTLLEYAAPFCRVGGQIILPKKGDLAVELAQGKRAAHQLGLVFKADVAVTLPGLADGRRLLVWEQQELCPARFPRSGAVMVKRPLR